MVSNLDRDRLSEPSAKSHKKFMWCAMENQVEMKKWLDIQYSKQFKISHIYKEGNGVADSVAKLELALPDFTWCYGVSRNAEIAYNKNLNNVVEFKAVH